VAIELERLKKALRSIDPVKEYGRVTRVVGTIIEAKSFAKTVGEVCVLETDNESKLYAEVVGFRDSTTMMMPLGDVLGVGPGTPVYATGKMLEVPCGEELLGRVIDGLGNPIDDKGPIFVSEKRAVYREPPEPLRRARIKEPLPTGVRAIDAFLTCGKGQRIGIFAGSGVGKSVLLGMIARYSSADVNVIGLIGERGREVREFIEKDLGEGLKKSIVVVATSDKPALVRLKAPFVATTIAEYFRDRGLHVLLMMDSITRIAMAQREVGLAVGEPPATKGYTPSVYAMLPRLLERAGTSDRGSITGIYTILVEGDDLSEPVADATRAILDGHIVLSRKLANQNHYPAIDILQSVSRVMIDVVDKEHIEAAKMARDLLSVYQENEDMVMIGAYKEGTNPKLDRAIALREKLVQFLRQDLNEKSEFNETVEKLKSLVT